MARDLAGSDAQVRSASLTVRYPALHAHTLHEDMRPYVLLEIGRARVVSFVPRDLSSWVHDYVARVGALARFTDNRPRAVRCIHPWVTCLEKLDAIARRFEPDQPAPDFVRHYEDAARILAAWDEFAPPAMDLQALLVALAADDGKRMPSATHPAFQVDPETARWQEFERAWERIGPMFWGPRTELGAACASIKAFLASLPAV